MDTEIRAGQIKCFQIFSVDEADIGKYGDKADTCMTFRQYKPIAVFPIRVIRVDSHESAVKQCCDVDHAERAADVSATRTERRFNDRASVFVSLRFDGEQFFFCQWHG